MQSERKECSNYRCKLIKFNLYWIIGLLSLVILGLLAFIIYIKRNESVFMGDLISISSGLVSIALAIIAIIYAISESIKTKDDSKRNEIILEKVKDVLDEVKDGLDKSNDVLDEVRDKTNKVDSKFDSLANAYKDNIREDFEEAIIETNTDITNNSDNKDFISSTGNEKIISNSDYENETNDSDNKDFISSTGNEKIKSNSDYEKGTKCLDSKEILSDSTSSMKLKASRDSKTITIRRGDIFCADFSPVIGSEQGGIRPAVVVQNDISNKYSSTVVVAPITSLINKAKLPTHVKLSSDEYNLNRDSVVLLEQVRVLDKKRLKEKIGHITDADMKKIEKSLLIQFSLL